MASFFKKHKAADKAGKDKKANATGEQKPPADTAPAAATDAIPPAAQGDTKPAPLLDDDDEQFLERLVTNRDEDKDDDDEHPPPLPPRPITPDLTWESDSESFRLPSKESADAPTTTSATTTAAATAPKKQNRLSRLFSRKSSTHPNSLTVPGAPTTNDTANLATPVPVPPEEADREWADLNRVLARLDLTPTTTTTAAAAAATTTTTASAATKAKSATKSAALAASAEVQSLLRQFVLVLRDIMRGAPTAVDDLVSLLDGRNDALKRGFEKLPRSMQKLVTQLPKKLTSALGPEVLLAAAEAQGLKRESGAAAAAAGKGKSGVAKFLAPRSLGELALTPAVVKSMLRAIVNALKVRWPAFVGTNLLWSTAVFLLLFVLWYCHKRGREEREKAEKEGLVVDGEGKVLGEVVEEEDGAGASAAVVVVEPPAESPRS